MTIIQFSFSDYYRLIHMYSHFGCFKSPRISCFRKLGVSLAAYETSTIKWIYPIVIISVIYISVYTKQPITCIYTRFINFATRLEKMIRNTLNDCAFFQFIIVLPCNMLKCCWVNELEFETFFKRQSTPAIGFSAVVSKDIYLGDNHTIWPSAY